MPRPDSPPDDPAYDDETPIHVQERMRALERLARDLYRFGRHHAPAAMSDGLVRRTVELLDLDPPGFDPATEGP